MQIEKETTTTTTFPFLNHVIMSISV